MAFWSAENATKAYLTTLKTDQRTKEPNVAEFISALAAGNNARKIAVACAGAANADILVALIAAANQTRGQVVCVLRGIEELIISKKMLEPSEIHHIQFVVGESNDNNLINDHFGKADFVLVDCNIKNHQDIVTKIVNHHEENARTGGGSVVVGYNAFSRGSWRFSDGRKTQFLPIGEGLLVTRVNDNGKYNQKMMNKNNVDHHDQHHDHVRKSHWVVKVDKCTGEEHVFRNQSRFAIVKGPVCFWEKNVLHDIMTTCIILHNVIIEDERDLDAPIEAGREAPPPEVQTPENDNIRFEEFLGRFRKIKDKEAHFALQNSLIDHLWERYTNGDA